MSLKQAIQAIKSGDKEIGRQLLSQTLETDPHNAMAWIWLSACYEDAAKRKECLQAAVRADPLNQIAFQGLKHLEAIEDAQLKKTLALLTSTESGPSETESTTKLAESEDAQPQFASVGRPHALCPP